jgi:hypothetical protein
MKSVSSRSERSRQVKILRQKIINGFKLSNMPTVLEDTSLSDYQFLVQAQQMFQAWENHQQETTVHWILMVGLLCTLSSLAMQSLTSEGSWFSLNGGIRIGVATLGVSLSYFAYRSYCGGGKPLPNDFESLVEMLAQLENLVSQPVLKRQADQKNILMEDKKPVKRKTDCVQQKIIKGEQQRKARQKSSIGALIQANVQWIKTWGYQTGIALWNHVPTTFHLSPRQKKQKDDTVPLPQSLPLASKKRRLVKPVKENLPQPSQPKHQDPKRVTAAVETKSSSGVVTPSSGDDVTASSVQSAPITPSASNPIAEVKLDNRPVMESTILNDPESKPPIEQPAGLTNQSRSFSLSDLGRKQTNSTGRN